MKIQELFDRIVLLSGQFLVPDDAIELDVNRFKTLVSMALGEYSRYCPYDCHFRASIQSTRQFTFSDANPPASVGNLVGGIPTNIVEAIPVRISGVSPFYLTSWRKSPTSAELKSEMPFVYRKPVLTVIASADYDLHLVYDHVVTQVNGGKRTDLEVVTISDKDINFIRFLQGLFLQSLGRNRRAFTLNPLPITTDASTMVEEGKEIEKDAHDKIVSEDCKWYLALR